jgi:hypothetical protein
MLVGDQDGIHRAGIFAAQKQSPHDFAARQPGINQ